MTSLVALSSGAALAADGPQATRGVIKLAPDAALDADTRFQRLANDYIEALWRLDPDAAIGAGRYEFAAELPAPDRAMRARSLSFASDWLKRFETVDAKALSAASRTDLGQLLNKLRSDRFQLTELREYEWNPSFLNIAGPIDYILATDYAPLPVRLKTISARLAQVPAYYRAGAALLKQPTLEHTQLAIDQAPGVLSVLDEVVKAAQGPDAASLTAAERKQLADRIAAAKVAVEGYRTQLQQLLADGKATDKTTSKARSFRLGKALYEQKFGYDIQSVHSAEQMYQRALKAREALLTQMAQISDQLWTQTMGDAPKPEDRFARIGAVIGKLSEQHVKREDFVKEIRAQIPQLERWITEHDLLTQDASKPLIVRETPVYQRGVAGAGIEAPGPYRPQDRTYYNVTPLDDLTPEQAESSLREYNRWILQILNIHEAVPGHYTQLVHANKSPSLVKTLFGNGAMVEGWAVYGERMMLESGYGANAPEMWLMWGKWNLRSVTNTILDYNVHVLGMTEAQALDLLQRQAFQTEREAREKWRRVQLTSVQLTSYFSGYSDIMELRDQRKQALGKDFQLKAFHEQFLSYGNAPVSVISELMSQPAAKAAP
ncbi:lipoprotein [Mitsuaria sp. 7]|nr:lipoprotein [Mitsuaria sp. 7]